MPRHKRRGASERRGYHHGNLREALIDAALELISEKGPGGFTFADAARSAGVSPAAPYRHFRDRDALMADIARRGFEKLAEDLATAAQAGADNPVARIERIGQAYIEFARREPALFSAMFESGLASSEQPAVRAAEDRAFEVLLRTCEALSATVENGQRPPAMMMALHFFSLAHGIAALYARGDDSRRTIPMSPNELLEAATLVYLDGLGIQA
ncbi:MAG: TetR/AcrR family transcriptional regulator [Myxococcota bacterium]